MFGIFAFITVVLNSLMFDLDIEKRHVVSMICSTRCRAWPTYQFKEHGYANSEKSPNLLKLGFQSFVTF